MYLKNDYIIIHAMESDSEWSKYNMEISATCFELLLLGRVHFVLFGHA